MKSDSRSPVGHDDDHDRELGLVDLFQFIWSYRYLIVAVAISVTVMSIVWAYLMTPIYKVRAVLAPVNASQSGLSAALGSQFGGLASFAGVNLSGDLATKEALGVMRSHALAAEFIKNQNLMPVLFSDVWSEDEEKWIVSEPDEVPTIWRAVNRFHENILTVSQDPVSRLVSVSIEWKDPAVAAEWLEKLIAMTNRNMQQRALDEAKRSIEFLKAELEGATLVEVRQAISRVIELQTNSLAMANSRTEYAFRVIDPPAIPDDRSPERPRKRVMAIVGLMMGGMLGILVAFLHHLSRRMKARAD